MVAAAWLAVTVVARSRFGRFRRCGTLPCTVATIAVGPGPGVVAGIRLPASAAPTAATASAPAVRRRPGRPRPNRVITAKATHPPASARTKVSSGGPPIAAQRDVGAPAWLIASRPHGNPPHGNRSRTASWATHQPATATGQARSRSSGRSPRASRANRTVSVPASAAQAYQATLSTQESSGTKNAAPDTRPRPAVAQPPLRQTARISSAGPTIANGQIPTGGNAAARAIPASNALSSDHQPGKPAVGAGAVSAAPPGSVA